jgi:ABC-type spermidine/putrescine transport system permease subunit I
LGCNALNSISAVTDSNDMLKQEKDRKPTLTRMSLVLVHRILLALSLTLMTCLNRKETETLQAQRVLGCNALNSIGAVTDPNDMLKQEKDGNPAGTKSLRL